MKKFLIGIDAGATNIKVGLIEAGSYKVIYRNISPTKRYIANQDTLISFLVSQIALILKRSNLSRKDILGVGLGLPGPVNSQQGKVYFLPNIPGWKNVPIKRIMETKLKIPVYVDNDVNLVTLAEWRLGAGVGSRNLLCVTLGTGVGGGLILDNKLYRGSHFLAGEVGHMPLNEVGPVCNCGGRACLERYVGNRYILSAARKSLRDSNLTLERLSFLSSRGSLAAHKIWQEVGRQVGIVLAGAINLLNLERIVVGGGVSSAGGQLFNSIRKTVSERAMPNQAKQVRIVKSKLSHDAGILGAAILAKEKF